MYPGYSETSGEEKCPIKKTEVSMRRILTIVFFTALSLIWGCAGGEKRVVRNEKPRDGVRTAAYKQMLDTPEIATNNLFYSAAVYRGRLYYLERRPDRYIIHVKEIETGKEEEIILNRGKGPGEVVHNLGIRIHDSRIYFCDLIMRRGNIYDLQGAYLDEFLLTDEIGNPWSFEVTDEAFYFAGTIRFKLSRVDRRTGEVRSLPFDKVYEGGVLPGGTLSVDKATGDVFLGYYGQPYRIEKYNKDLELVMSFSRKGLEHYPSPEYFRNEVTDGTVGCYLISSMRNDGRFLYVANPNGQEFDKEWSYRVMDYFFDVYDMKTGRYVSQIRVARPEEIQGDNVLVDIEQGRIFSLVTDYGTATRKMWPDTEKISSRTLFVFDIE